MRSISGYSTNKWPRLAEKRGIAGSRFWRDKIRGDPFCTNDGGAASGMETALARPPRRHFADVDSRARECLADQHHAPFVPTRTARAAENAPTLAHPRESEGGRVPPNRL